jgi:hypothetical protein
MIEGNDVPECMQMELVANGSSTHAVVQDVELRGSGQSTPKEAPVRPPRPSGQGSKSRLVANRDKLLQQNNPLCSKITVYIAI